MMWKRKAKQVLKVAVRSLKDREKAARGIGVGLFVGFLPSIGFQIILAVILATAIRGDRIIAAVGTLVTNPLTILPIATVSTFLGDWLLLNQEIEFQAERFTSWSGIGSLGADVLHAYLVGCLALGVFFGAVGYATAKFCNFQALSPARKKR